MFREWLFDDHRKLARRDDPETSHEAAAEMHGSEAQGRLVRIAVAQVCEYPGETAKELERRLGVEDGQLRKRLNDAWRMGLISKGEPRRCTVSGRRAQTWVPM
jgi:hypothetical protein